MTDARVQRRLAAILAADVVGYSRLMEANEEATMTALKGHRREVLDPAVADHGGRIFKTMGDGFLVEFSSVVAAMRCALDVQRAMAGRNAGLPEDRHIRFRIGLNLGDLIVDGDDFYGDGLNLAARIEGLAPPGGIACSSIVRDQIGNRLDIAFADMGERTVKNIGQPVRVFAVEPARAAATVAPSRHARPSVAVLPFANMSNDPEQEFFSDGITEDIITDLSNVSALFVLGRNTVFTYKGKSVNLEETARQLGVAWLVEGSVRKAGNRVRITAQLIEGATGGHVWAARYDRDLTDIFAVQDEITRTIVEQLKVKLLPEERQAIERPQTGNVEAYTAYLKGLDLYRLETKVALRRARRMFARAIELDPGYARAYAGSARAAAYLRSQYGEGIAFGEIIAETDRALSLDPGLAEAHVARGCACEGENRNEDALAALGQALALDPLSFDMHIQFGRYHMKLGAFEESARHYMRAMEIRPEEFVAPMMIAQAMQALGRSDEAMAYARIGNLRAEEMQRHHPENSRPAQMLAVSHAFLGDPAKARHWLSRALSIDPDDNQVRYNAACAYAMLGEAETAIDLLEVWIGQVASDMKLWFRNDPDFEGIKDHPRFRRLVETTDWPG